MLVPVLVWLETVRLGRVLAPGDGLTYYLPVHVLAARTWRDGVVPGWDPFSFAGSPLLATSQVGVFSPPNLVHLLLPAATAHTALVVLALVVAALGATLLAHRLTGDVVAATVAGLAFGLSGFMFGHLNHLSMAATAAWLPWAVLGLERLLDRPRPLRLLGAAAPVTAAALAGHPQLLLVVTAVVALWGGCLAASRRSPAALALTGLALAAGVALAAVQLLPVLLHLGESDRTSLGFGEAMSWSFSPSHALLLVFPHLFGSQGGSGPFPAPYGGEWSLTELSGYVGAAALVLAAAGLGPARRAGRLLPLAVVAVVAGLVALGDSTPVGRLVHALPVLGQLRSWGRATVAVDLAVAVLAAYGTARLRTAAPGARRAVGGGAGVLGPQSAAAGLGARRAVVVGAGVVVVLAGAAVLSPHRAAGTHGWWAIALPLGAVAAVVVATRMPRAALSSLLVVVVAADMVLSFGWWHRWREQSPTTAEVAAVLDPDVAPRWGQVPDTPGGVDRVAFAFREPLRALPDIPRATSVKGIRTVGGYDPLAPGAYLDVAGVDYRGAVDPASRLLSPGSHVADLLRVTWVVGDDLQGRARTAALPEAFLVGEARETTRAAAVAAAHGEVPFDPAATALVEGCEPCRAATDPGPAGRAGAVRRGPSSARVEVDADRPAVLVVSEAWAPGWSATVDGESAPVVRVDGVVQGVPVPAGRSVVSLEHRPPGLRAGAATSLAVLAALVAVSARTRTRSARPGTASTSPPQPTAGTST